MSIDIPVYLINLAWASERRERMEAHLKDVNLSYELVTATDGNFLNEYDNLRYSMNKNSPYLSRLLTTGERGCSISHRNVYEMILQRNQDYALILEDDAVITNDALTFLRNIKNIPIEWNLIYLGYYVHTLGEPFFKTSLYPISLWKNRRLNFLNTMDYHIGKFILRPRGAFGYIITRKAARMVLEYSSKHNALMSDRYLSSCEIPGTLGISPSLLYHNDEKIERCILGRPLAAPHYNVAIRSLNKIESWLIKAFPFIKLLTRFMRLAIRRIRATLLFVLSRDYVKGSIDPDI